MTEIKEDTTVDPLDIDDDSQDTEIEMDGIEKQYCCDIEKRKRIEKLREERELNRELREFYDD